MKTLVFPKPLILIKVLTPGLIGVLTLSLERTIRSGFLQTESNVWNEDPHLTHETGSNWLLALISGVLRTLGEMIFESYYNYLAFLFMMLLVNVFFHGSDIIRYFLTKREQVLLGSSWKNFLVDQDFLKQGLRPLMKYSLIFCFYQIIWIALASSVPLQALQEVTKSPLNIAENIQVDLILPSRILQQQEERTSLAVSPSDHIKKKPSLSIGKILGQVDIYACSIKLSKDGKTAFVTTFFPGTFQIIDIRDPEDPTVLSTFNLPSRASDFISRTILVSPDETKLYISNFDFLQIIDITNLKSPSLIASVETKIWFMIPPAVTIRGFAKPNLLLSRNGKFLFVSGYGLQVFDLSAPAAPVRIHVAISQKNAEGLVPSSIALSDDSKTLYYTDGSFWIYNVENPRNMNLLNSFNLTHIITSMILSDDVKTAFVIGQDDESKVFLQKLDVSDTHSIKAKKVRKFGQKIISQPVFLEKTPENRFMMILFEEEYQLDWSGILTFDTQREQVLSDKRLLVKSPMSVLFTDDYQRALVGDGLGKLKIVDLYLDFPNQHAFSGSSNIIKTFDAEFDFFSFSKDENMVYSVDNDRSESPKNVFRVHQFTPSNLSNISDYEVQDEVFQMIISQDSNRAFLLSAKKIEIADISNPKDIKKLGEESWESKLNFLSVSRDGKTGFLTLCWRRLDNFLEILDLSNPQKVIKKGSVNLGELAEVVTTILSNDDQTLFVIATKLLVYNVSDLLKPKLIATLSFLSEESYYLSRVSGILSPDGKTLFLRDEGMTRDTKIYLVDVSDVSSPQIQSDFRFPSAQNKQSYTMNVEKTFLVSLDSKTLYISTTDSLVVIDVSNVKSPKYLGSIKVLEDSGSDYISDFSLSNDDKRIFVKTIVGKLHIVAIDPVYTTFIKQDTLMLGERYNIDLQVLKMNEFLDYHGLEIDYRFTKLALVEHRSTQNKDFEKVLLKPAPSWMAFDLKTQTLSVEARRKNDIGNYRVYFGFSAQIEVKAFSVINDTLDCEDLAATLLAVGYIDSQRYLTEDFGTLEDFLLPREYLDVKEEIYKILKRYSFATYNELKIVESLGVLVDDDDKLKVSTSSLANLKVEISVREEVQFLSRHYGSLAPVITGSKSRLILEGSLKDINLALQEVVINIPKGVSSCDGEIVIDDKLNPIKTESVKNISRFFYHNQSPKLNSKSNLTVQNQIDKESLKTGQYFQIKLNQKTFFDNFTQVEDLNYQVTFMKGNNETTVLPNWLSFSDMTLMGTAPEEMFDRTFEFKLVVKNEFQEMKVPFTLQVNISSSFILKLLMKYSPYILSVVGLIISANKIFNIICKGTYKHPKNFVLRIGQEVTSEVIFPISFIREEIEEAKKILRVIERRIGAKNPIEFLLYFMLADRKLDKLRILETVKESLGRLNYQEKRDFSLYLEGDEEEFHPRRLINQIILNILTNQMLKLNEEKETKEYFEKIKGNWPMFVEWDLMNSAFKIKNEKLNAFLQRGRSLTESTLTNDMEDGLLDKENINIDLLKNAILAYAFECQNIDAQPVFTQLNVKEKIKTNFLKRFLKLDLGESPYHEKGKIGFGIGYCREYSTVCFNGVVKPDMRNKTIAIQITDLKHKILKELWVFQNEEGERSERFLDEKSEIEAKGKDYEIF